MGSVTFWLKQLDVGDALIAQQLWEANFPRLVLLARTKLQRTRRLIRQAWEKEVAP
jgi:hypothetical protein